MHLIKIIKLPDSIDKQWMLTLVIWLLGYRLKFVKRKTVFKLINWWPQGGDVDGVQLTTAGHEHNYIVLLY